jgi:hypothetical protein
LKAGWATQKTSSNIFIENKENYAMLDRSIPTREAFFHSILISEVKDMESDVLRAMEASRFEKKPLNLICGLNFNNFQERKIA